MFLELNGESKPGIIVEGPGPKMVQGGLEISNFFLPIVGCDLIRYESGGSYNNDQFMILNQISFFRNEEGGLILAPSKDYDDFALVIVQLCDSRSHVLPKFAGPEFVQRIEFDEGDLSDIFILIIKKNCSSTLFSFNSKEEVLEYTFHYDYKSFEVGFKVKKMQ